MKRYLCAFLIAVFFVAACVPATLVQKIGGSGSSEGGGNIDTTIVQLDESIFAATRMLAKAVIETFNAVGKKTEALKYQATLDDIEKNKEKYKNDPDALKEKFNEINNASNELKNVDMAKVEATEEGKASVKRGLLDVGAGIFLDVKAADYAKTLVSVLPNEIQANPTKAIKLKAVLSLAQMVATEVPKQLTSMKDTSTNLMKYSTAHNVAPPTAEEKKALVQKEAASVPVSEGDFS